MATQETTLGHLGKVRGMGDDGHHPLAPEERRGDAEEEDEEEEAPKPEVDRNHRNGAVKRESAGGAGANDDAGNA